MNLEKYFDKLKLSTDDKLFFKYIIKPNVIIDFGCADGFLCNAIRTDKYQPRYIGYDRSHIIKKIQKKFDGIDNAVLSYDFEDLLFLIQNNDEDNSALMLSSVLHEIFSHKEEVDAFRLFSRMHPKYIVIRDMYCDAHALLKTHLNEMTCLRDMYKGHEDKLNDLARQSTHGTPTIYKNFIHYFLKSFHIDNLDHEIKEDYLSVDIDKVLTFFGIIGYKVIHQRIYKLPYLNDYLKEKCDMELRSSTHVQIVMERENKYYPSLEFRRKTLQDIDF